MTARVTVSTGVEGLDDRLEGGFPQNRAVLVCGATGTGKTTFGVQFLMAGVHRGEAGIFVSIDQKPQHVAEDANSLGWDLSLASDLKQLVLFDASPYFTATRGKSPVQVTHITNDLTQQVRRLRARRLVIDSLTSLTPPGVSPIEEQNFLRSLFFSLEDNMGCTVVMTAQTPGSVEVAPAVSRAEMFASGLLELKLATTGRSLVVRKMRGTRTDLTPFSFDIVNDRGIVFCATGEPASVGPAARHG